MVFGKKRVFWGRFGPFWGPVSDPHFPPQTVTGGPHWVLSTPKVRFEWFMVPRNHPPRIRLIAHTHSTELIYTKMGLACLLLACLLACLLLAKKTGFSPG